MPIRFGVLTVSDKGAAGEREDKSGDTIVDWIGQAGFDLAAREIVADESDLIAKLLTRWADADIVDVIVTTGGTGFTPRDVTPEATRAVLEREAPGISEAIRAATRETFPRSMLSRGVAGIRGSTLIVNLPGSVGGVRDGIATLSPVIEHAVQLLRNEPTDH
jgi:molybdenum cofactor synthesis domain-containing protein